MSPPRTVFSFPVVAAALVALTLTLPTSSEAKGRAARPPPPTAEAPALNAPAELKPAVLRSLPEPVKAQAQRAALEAGQARFLTPHAAPQV